MDDFLMNCVYIREVRFEVYLKSASGSSLKYGQFPLTICFVEVVQIAPASRFVSYRYVKYDLVTIFETMAVHKRIEVLNCPCL